jgi:hypothetical protein
MPDDPLHDLDEALEELERMSIRTSQGSFVKTEDARRLLQARKDAVEESAAKPNPKTMREAKKLVRADPEIASKFPSGPREAGRSIPAGPQPSSRT